MDTDVPTHDATPVMTRVDIQEMFKTVCDIDSLESVIDDQE